MITCFIVPCSRGMKKRFGFRLYKSTPEIAMMPFELNIGLRNLLLMQLALIFLAPTYAFEVRRELLRLWRSIHAPFLRKKAPKKGSFWEIDMTKFEP